MIKKNPFKNNIIGCAMVRSFSLSKLGDLESRLPLWFSKVTFSLIRAGYRGRVQGVRPPRELTCGFLIQLVFCIKFCLRHQSVTPFLNGAPSTKKNPGSALVNYNLGITVTRLSAEIRLENFVIVMIKPIISKALLIMYCVIVMRALGIPTRSVTNFGSAHDTDASMTIDYHFDEEGEMIHNMNDSVW